MPQLVWTGKKKAHAFAPKARRKKEKITETQAFRIFILYQEGGCWGYIASQLIELCILQERAFDAHK